MRSKVFLAMAIGLALSACAPHTIYLRADGQAPGNDPVLHQQFEMDREICQQAHHPDCWVNQLRRLQHCEQTGEVNTPGLGFGPRGRR